MSDDAVNTGGRAFFNGVDRSSGCYLYGPEDLATLASDLDGQAPGGTLQGSLQVRHDADEDDLGVMFGFDPEDLASVGWGVVFGYDVGEDVVARLEPLLSLREGMAGERFRRLTYERGEDVSKWLDRYEAAPNVVDPRKVPYYLLLVGGPTTIPFEFQYQLGIDYAVGRAHFDDLEDYGRYADAVCSAEQTASPAAAHLFGPRNPGDEATALSSTHLLEPLAAALTDFRPDLAPGTDIGPGATRDRLKQLLTGADAPAVLFTASHGLGDSGTVDRQIQGALVCQEWPGPLRRNGVSDGHFFAGRDLASDAAVKAQVVFTFACFGAGTPAISDFGYRQLCQEPFVASLPQRLLANPAGGALAFVGHIDRAFSYSFMWTGFDSQVTAMTSTMLALLSGRRLGSAMESVTSRYATIAAYLADRLGERLKFGRVIDAETLVGLWTAYYDARNYVILGDPAVRAVRA